MKGRNTLLLFHKIRLSSGGNCHLFMLRKEFVELQSLCSAWTDGNATISNGRDFNSEELGLLILETVTYSI